MSNATHEEICPNCNFHTTENFCARCGQEVHLHDDTLRALFVHFIGHYFHYDSKFWKTLKALWFKPGELTLAYWNRQRARFISPISLYIFISALFFLTSALWPERDDPKATQHTTGTTVANTQAHEAPAKRKSNSFLSRRIHERKKLLDSEGPESDAFLEKFIHAVPKIFFFMIPFTALVLRLLFARRKVKVVHHTIFSLHVHSFWFSAMTIPNFYPFEKFSNFLMMFAAAAGTVYYIAAMRRVYSTGWLRSILYTTIIGAIYLLCLVIIFMGLYLFL